MYTYTEQDIEDRAYGYYALSLKELKEEARKEKLKGYRKFNKRELAVALALHTYESDPCYTKI